MKIIFCLFLLFLSVIAEDDCYCRIHHKKRIVHGSRTRRNSNPWVVSLAKNDEHYCGGTIINKRLILTAAHCVDKLSPSEIKVRAGVLRLEEITDEQVYNVAKIHMNSYKTTQLPGDIAILSLARDLELKKKYIEKACYNLKKQKYPTEDNTLVATGWGHIESSYVNNTTGEFFESRNARRLRHANFEEITPCKDHLICVNAETEGDSICKGDGGSSIVYIDKGFVSVEGVASHSVTKNVKGVIYHCTGEAAFSRLSYYAIWFKKIVGRDYCKISKKRGGLLKNLFS